METVPSWDEVGVGSNRCVFAMVISNQFRDFVRLYQVDVVKDNSHWCRPDIFPDIHLGFYSPH